MSTFFAFQIKYINNKHMSKRIYTKEQLDKLSSNANVVRCSERSITYSNEFKKSAIKQYNEQFLTSKEIFINAGFDLEVIGSNAPKTCLKCWKKIYKTRGVEGFIESRGRAGGRIKTKNLSDADKIKRLEAQVAYLKAENDFLDKLRAKRAE